LARKNKTPEAEFVHSMPSGQRNRAAASTPPGGQILAEEDAIWHVVVDGAQQGPLTKAEIFKLLRGGTLVGSDLVWCPGFPEWKSVGEINEFWRPQPPMTTGVKVLGQSQTLFDQPRRTDEPLVGKKWSLWKSANIGLLVGALTLIVQVANGRGFELANYAHTGSAATISFLTCRTLAAPLIFVLVASVRNLTNRRRSRSSASAVKWALTFAALLVGIFATLFVYGEVFFSSTEAISGEDRKAFIAEVQLTCVQKQRTTSPAVTEARIHSYCTCVSEKMADGTTYKQLGTEPDASALADLRQQAEAVGYACRIIPSQTHTPELEVPAANGIAERPPAGSSTKGASPALTPEVNGAAHHVAPRMSLSMASALDAWLMESYLKCWTLPQAMPKGDVYVAQIKVVFNPDGSLSARPVLLNPPTDPAWRPHAESAKLAVKKCDPLHVSSQYAPYFEEWKVETVHFDPRETQG
jgi:hypothetical protein